MIAVLAAGIGCSDGKADKGDVSGTWCGRDVAAAADCVGDEVFYLDLVQAGSEVTGDWCEAYNHDCLPIEEGTFANRTLTFDAPVDTTSTVTASLTMSDDGQRLGGKFAETDNSSGGSVSLSVTLHRID